MSGRQKITRQTAQHLARYIFDGNVNQRYRQEDIDAMIKRMEEKGLIEVEQPPTLSEAVGVILTNVEVGHQEIPAYFVCISQRHIDLLKEALAHYKKSTEVKITELMQKVVAENQDFPPVRIFSEQQWIYLRQLLGYEGPTE